MIRRPPRSTLSSSSAASDVYKRQDPKAALDLKNIMKELCRQGSAIFFSTHVLEVAQKLCNKIAIIKAVSYTHLRAHETDSYLVCRLLLEKKNKTKRK